MNTRPITSAFAFMTLVAGSFASDIGTTELERFWRDFPGHRNTLASYGYDRSFSSSALPEFVDAAVKDLAKRPSKLRRGEYACVLFYMKRPVVVSRLAAIAHSGSAPERRVAEQLQNKLTSMDAEGEERAKQKPR